MADDDAAARRRAAAEARRKRILSKSLERMKAVGGEEDDKVVSISREVEHSHDRFSETETEAEAGVESNIADVGAISDSSDIPVTDKAKATDASGAVPGNDDAVVDKAENIPDIPANDSSPELAPEPPLDACVEANKESKSTTKTPTVSSGSRKLQQMRRRRFKQKQEKMEESEALDERGAAAGDGQQENVDRNHIGKETTVDELPLLSGGARTSNDGVESAGETIECGQTDEEPKKQYMGVAKMRRKKILEERTKQQKKLEKGISKSAKKVETISEKITERRQRALRTPLLLEIFTVTLLFAAGLDVGWDSYLKNIDETDAFGGGRSDVFRTRTRGGKLFPWVVLEGEVSVDQVHPHERLIHSQILEDGTITPVGDDIDDGVEEEEFTNSAKEKQKPKGASDEAEKGMSGEDVVAQLMFLLFFPITYCRETFFFWRHECPPVFCLIAFVIRRFGRICGACPPEDATSQSSSGKVGAKGEKVGGIDPVRMIKDLVAGSFPTIVWLYRTLMDARADMYVVLCGFFFGLTVLPEVFLRWNLMEAETIPSIIRGDGKEL